MNNEPTAGTGRVALCALMVAWWATCASSLRTVDCAQEGLVGTFATLPQADVPSDSCTRRGMGRSGLRQVTGCRPSVTARGVPVFRRRGQAVDVGERWCGRRWVARSIRPGRQRCCLSCGRDTLPRCRRAALEAEGCVGRLRWWEHVVGRVAPFPRSLGWPPSYMMPHHGIVLAFSRWRRPLVCSRALLPSACGERRKWSQRSTREIPTHARLLRKQRPMRSGSSCGR